jgi:sulfite exporter TauE/SafE
MNNFAILTSLISLGFFGGFTHCAGMCGPFVFTQVSNRLQKTSLTNFSNFKKLQNLALLPYQAGRITTYSVIGFCSSLLTTNVSNLSNFRFFSAALLFAASLFFLNIFFEKKILRFKPKLLKKFPSFFRFKFQFRTQFLNSLFLEPRGFKGYCLGVILGFIPCGLLYGAFLIAATIPNPFLAAFGMFLFGVGTFPALFLTASGGYFLTKLPEFKLIAKFIILINAIMLFLMALKILN